MHRLRALAAIGVLVVASAPAPAQTAADDSSSLSCADFNAAAAQVTAGKNATAAQKRTALDAQDYIGTGMVWLHGYLTGRNGPQVGKLTREWITENVAKLGRECAAAADPANARLVDLVTKP
ncbi:hypothetical protein QTH90_02345 [Variovorax sp. J2P1-59]|uniref:hypothetical protein n=1 Tax=Variovorax flavidus TaxID=3053501 RepID=UPI002578A999|nr:hypothetical protein [Variovorax sp. J2P1-59]MDM0073204.1 hypothetical protein [Variovorax sp. J2P1-59]